MYAETYRGGLFGTIYSLYKGAIVFSEHQRTQRHHKIAQQKQIAKLFKSVNLVTL